MPASRDQVTRVAQLESVARRLTGSGCHVGAALFTKEKAGESDDFQAELQHLGPASAKRRAEFLAGRLALRRAQKQMGVKDFPVFPGADRAPIWPADFLGSISHADGVAIAVLRKSAPAAFIGIDLEPDEPLDTDLLDIILLKAERGQVSALPQPAKRAKLIFSCKEAIYKAQYPMTGEVFGFDSIHVQVDEEHGAFVGHFMKPAGPIAKGTMFQGKFCVFDGLILSVCSSDHGQPAALFPA